MKKYRSLSTRQSEQEIICVWVYFILQLLVLPSCLIWLNARTGYPMKEAERNFIFFAVNFAAVVWIFHRFLSSSFRQVRLHPAYFCQAVILGLAAYYVCSEGMNWLLARVAPGFSNANDASIAALSRGNYTLMVLGTVLLVPPAEECFYRGLIFRPSMGSLPWQLHLPRGRQRQRQEHPSQTVLRAHTPRRGHRHDPRSGHLPAAEPRRLPP